MSDKESSLSIPPTEALKVLVEVRDCRDRAKKILVQFRDSTEQMTSGAWQGEASKVHLTKTDNNDQEFNQIIALLDRTVEAAETGINNALKADQLRHS